MLRRKITDQLRAWRAGRGRECLLVKGARQVGKTYAISDFGRSDYESLVEVNFVERPELAGAFDGPLDPEEVRRRISLLLPGASFPRGRTLLFLDEIQECPNARTALKFLAQDPGMDVIASGSLLGISYRQSEVPSIPVGYERQVEMHGLDFEEYLWAVGYPEGAVDALRGYLAEESAVPQPVHERMLRTLREHMAVGGMPAVVSCFVSEDSFSAAHDEQLKIIASHLDDIAKYAPPNVRAKSRACYQSMPRQLAKENTKFQYGVVEKRGTARKFDTAVDLLEEANLVRRCQHVSTPSFPLAAYESDDRFRLYLNDTGLLTAMYGFEMKAAVVGDSLSGPMKGGLYENLVADMLVKAGRPLRYWRNDRGDREMEFVLDGPASVEAVEVKAKRGASASLDAMLEADETMAGVKLGSVNVGRSGRKLTLPLYLAPFLFESA